MKLVEKYITPLIESQFPEFYKDQGPLFILFVEEYYKWLEENNPDYSSYDEETIADGNPNYHLRRLFDYRDIDKTLEGFLVYFKEKYLKGVQTSTNISQRSLIKAAQDIFTSKGSERSIDLLFKLVYGANVQIYTPGDNILKASDGTWVVPAYLELTQSFKNIIFPGKQVTGSISQATAFVEYVITRNINGKIIDIAYITNVKGNFLTGESLLDDGLIANAPKIVGSLSSIDITTGGELFTLGEIVKLTSPEGVEGLARVTGLDSVTGLVRFTIIDGGWGYSVDANTFVSEKTIAISNTVGAFERFETVIQNNFSFSLNNVTGELEENTIILNGNTSTPSISVSVGVTQNLNTTPNTATLILSQSSGNVFSNTILYEKNKALVATFGGSELSVGDQVVQQTAGTNNVFGTIKSKSNTVILEINTATIGANGIHVGTYLKQQSTGAEGVIGAIPRENLFTYSNVDFISVRSISGSFNNTSVVNVYSNSSLTTQLGTFSITTSSNGVFPGISYTLVDTNLTTSTRWSFGNTVIKVGEPSKNTTILVASDIGGIAVSCTDVSATGNVIGSNSSTIGLINVNSTFYANSITQIKGITTNTTANTIVIYQGQNADFSIGVIENSENVRLSSDLLNANNDGPGANSVKYMEMIITGANSTYGNLSSVYIELAGTGYNNTNIVTFSGGNTGAGSFEAANASITTNASGVILSVTLSANVGNGIVSTPAVSIVNSTGGATGVGTGASLVPVSFLGFPKLPSGDITFPLIDLLTFSTKTIGTISSLTGLNPGEQYNANPFALALEKEVAAYGKKDILIDIVIQSGPGFVLGEAVEQTINTPAISIVANNYSGNTGNNFEVSEFVYVNDGVSNTGNGIVYSSTYDLSSNSWTIVVSSNSGTFGVGNTLTGTTTNSSVTIQSTSAYTASALARGVIKLVSNTTLGLKRTSLFTDFEVNKIAVGKTSGTQANVTGTAIDMSSRAVGDNANIAANVVASNGSIQSVEIVSSGFGYEDDLEITINSFDGVRQATGQGNVLRQGVGEGYYSSVRGFLNDSMFLQDGDYYQNYSYEVRTSIPLETYSELLKELLHIAGKKYFGRLTTLPVANVQLLVNSTVIIS